jgi:hypothetical protein
VGRKGEVQRVHGSCVAFGRRWTRTERVRCALEHEAVEQGVEADEAEHNGASQLNSSVGQTDRWIAERNHRLGVAPCLRKRHGASALVAGPRGGGSKASRFIASSLAPSRGSSGLAAADRGPVKVRVLPAAQRRLTPASLFSEALARPCRLEVERGCRVDGRCQWVPRSPARRQQAAVATSSEVVLASRSRVLSCHSFVA